MLLCRSDNEDENPNVLLRASAGVPQCTARLPTEPHPEPQRLVAHHRHAGELLCEWRESFLFSTDLNVSCPVFQLALAIADLALQMASWKGCVHTLIEK